MHFRKHTYIIILNKRFIFPLLEIFSFLNFVHLNLSFVSDEKLFVGVKCYIYYYFQTFLTILNVFQSLIDAARLKDTQENHPI